MPDFCKIKRNENVEDGTDNEYGSGQTLLTITYGELRTDRELINLIQH